MKPVRSAASCPFCHGGESGAVLARFPDSTARRGPSEKTYYRCHHCGIIYLNRLNEPSIVYNRNYFFDLYKEQYGKTYLEDFPSLVEIGRNRMKQIIKIHHTEAPRHGGEADKEEDAVKESSPLRLCASVRGSLEKMPNLLDIGCAYGPFLAAAAETGFNPVGIEPIGDAVRYVREKLGFDCWEGFFPDALPDDLINPQNNEGRRFDVISLWYVIEHFRKPGEMLMEIYNLLKDGGVLAFSTPSFTGISGRKALRSFLKSSPGDHFTIWSPLSCRKILKQYGFELRKTVVTGHHPERFPLPGRLLTPGKKCLFYRLLLFISRLFRLGDTFEAYAVKVPVSSCSS